MEIGTLVQVSPNIQVGVHGVVSNMLKYAGKISKVIKNQDSIILLDFPEQCWYWDSSDLNPITLEVGDTVKIADDIQVGRHGVGPSMLKYAGKTTKIVRIGSDVFYLEIDPFWFWSYYDLIKMDMKFKPGDRVKINSNINCGQYSVVEAMIKHAGKEAVIVSDGPSGKYYHLDIDNSNWWWHADILTSVDKHITLDSLIDDQKVVCAFTGKNKTFLRSQIIEVRANRSAVKLQDLNKWIPIQQIHADAKMLADEINSPDIKVYYESPYLGRIEIVDWDSSEEFPLLIKTSDGDEFELTSEGKMFKDSQISVL